MTRTVTDIIRVPLGAGLHGDPTRGAGLLELAGVLSEARWTDRPSSVHPLLAVLAQSVGDRLGPYGARTAVVFAPWLCSTHTARPGAARAVVLACTNAALPYATGKTRTTALRTVQTATEELAGLTRWPQQQAWHSGHEARVAGVAVRRSVRVIADALPRGTGRDVELLGLLENSINAARGARGRGPVHPRLPIEHCPLHIDVVAGWVSHPVTGRRMRSYRPVDPDWGIRLVRAAICGDLSFAAPDEPVVPRPRRWNRVRDWFSALRA
jgi:hypothetical protein